MSLTGFAQGVIVNLFLLMGFVALFSMLRDWPAARLRTMPAWVNGLLFGVMAVVAMLVPSVSMPGVFFDCRTGIVGTAALLGGPVCALTCVPLPALYRLHAGGAGAVPGLMEIVLPALIGSLWYWLWRRRPPALRRILLGAVVVGAATTCMTVVYAQLSMPQSARQLGMIAQALVVLNGPLSTVLFSLMLVLASRHAESIELHSHVLRTAMEGYILVESGGRVLDVNDAYCRMCGYSARELRLMSIPELDAVMAGEEVLRRWRESAAGASGRFESKHRRKDGSTFDVEVSVRCLPGDRSRMVSFVRDITEQKAAAHALKESERKYELLIETTNTGFVILDEAGKVLDANPEYVKMTGRCSLEEIRGRPVTEWTAQYDLGRNAAEVSKCLSSGSVRNLEIDYVDPQGRAAPIEIHASVLPGTPIRILTVCRDIRERKLAAAEQARLQAQLTQAQKMESVGRLAGGVAHDFNNNLGVILGWTELALQELPPGTELHAALQQIQDAAWRSANLTNQLLAFARKQTAAPKVLDLNATVESMLKMLRRLIGEDVELLWKPGRGLGSVRIDPVQVDQVLANLCVNARDAIGSTHGTVTIETGTAELDKAYCEAHSGASPGRHVALAITDSGCGMDAATLANVFEPFFTTKGVGKGSGLGLATVYGIVKQNHGAIDARSEPGKGATFRVYLPQHVAGAEESSARADEQAPRQGKETILLVEDDVALLATVRASLDQLGYTVLAAAAPGAALRLVREHTGPIDLLVTDVVMPEMNGRDLAMALEALRPGLKCLFISGHTADVIARHGVLDEGVRFLQKPFRQRDLADKVRAALES
jgi:two-component system, cell cycle sensor histidine kinase and response regulator CckA